MASSTWVQIETKYGELELPPRDILTGTAYSLPSMPPTIHTVVLTPSYPDRIQTRTISPNLPPAYLTKPIEEFIDGSFGTHALSLRFYGSKINITKQPVPPISSVKGDLYYSILATPFSYAFQPFTVPGFGIKDIHLLEIGYDPSINSG